MPVTTAALDNMPKDVRFEMSESTAKGKAEGHEALLLALVSGHPL